MTSSDIKKLFQRCASYIETDYFAAKSDVIMIIVIITLCYKLKNHKFVLIRTAILLRSIFINL